MIEMIAKTGLVLVSVIACLQKCRFKLMYAEGNHRRVFLNQKLKTI